MDFRSFRAMWICVSFREIGHKVPGPQISTFCYMLVSVGFRWLINLLSNLWKPKCLIADVIWPSHVSLTVWQSSPIEKGKTG